ncbi:MAG TPA: hypothetical protein VMN43_08340, partial [Aestuariivirgaceae bacterium]|nr:hypothetical protein [Aestuariivirgaceae bacterium]
MNRIARSLLLLSVLLICAGSMTTGARADEEPPVVRALLDSSAINASARPTYRSLDVAADGTITLSDLKATLQPDGEADTAMGYDVATLTLADVKEISPGLFEVGAAEWSRMTVTSGDESFAAIPLITGKSVYIRQPGEEPTALERMRASNVLAKEVAIPEAMMLVAGQAIAFEGLSATWEGDPTTGAGTSRFTARRIHIPGGLFEEDENPLTMAGYDELELAIEGTTSTTYSDDAFGFDLEMRFDGRDIGSLIIDLGADGIPLALFGAIDAAEPDPDKLLGFADGISFKRARLRFEDNSLTGRLLSLMAEVEDTDVDTIVADTIEGIEVVLE